RLAGETIEPNVFYEPWMLRPALAAFAGDSALQFALIYAGEKDARRLAGFFPLERVRRCRGLPVSCLRLWKHPHCYLCTPLLHPEHAAACLTELVDWAAREAAVLELPTVPGDGPFHRLLVEEFHRRGTAAFVPQAYTRAILRPASDAETHLRSAVSAKG